ncbi:WD domain, G-beta repeat-containing protein [Toxoplasma gondii CAST]|uniref:WD domain, G-beta repeat-containing protein n=1 Tax=Toxoplasma gondii CAST TaxID=943122 RepID=A0A3R8BP50_TOXGO|nr:WD domain, G-beta repeat-containing protein [Toxoplasma gondii CAST]
MSLRKRQEEQLHQALLLYLQQRFPETARVFQEEAQLHVSRKKDGREGLHSHYAGATSVSTGAARTPPDPQTQSRSRTLLAAALARWPRLYVHLKWWTRKACGTEVTACAGDLGDMQTGLNADQSRKRV